MSYIALCHSDDFTCVISSSNLLVQPNRLSVFLSLFQDCLLLISLRNENCVSGVQSWIVLPPRCSYQPHWLQEGLWRKFRFFSLPTSFISFNTIYARLLWKVHFYGSHRRANNIAQQTTWNVSITVLWSSGHPYYRGFSPRKKQTFFS